MEVTEVISPVGIETKKPENVSTRVGSLDGKTVCETWNQDFKGDFMFPLYRELLKERYRDIRFIPYTEFPVSPLTGSPKYQREVAKKIAQMAKEKGCDVMISGNGG